MDIVGFVAAWFLGSAAVIMAPAYTPSLLNAYASRFGKPSGPISLVLDLLMDAEGWTSNYPRLMRHVTGAAITWDWEGKTERVEIGGQPLPLTRADKLYVKRARLRLERDATIAAQSAAVRQFADNARTYWEQREQQVAEVVPFKRKG